MNAVLKFLPLLLVGVVGWFFVRSANFGPFNASGGSLYSAIGIAAGVALFSFIGVEVAAITAKRVRNPRRNVGRASVLGTGACAILYLLVSAAVMGLVPHRALVGNTAPFVPAFEAIFTHGAWAGKFVAAVAVVSAIGALNGWTLVTTEVSRAVAADDLFPRPFAWTDRRGNAWFGIIIAALLPSLLMLWRYTTSTGLTVFIDLVDLTVVTVALPYLFSACAQLTYLVSRRRRVQGWLLARDLTVAGASVLFSMWVTFASGYSAVYQALVLVLAGLVLYAFLNARREGLGEAPEPADLPAGHRGGAIDEIMPYRGTTRFPGCSRCSPRRLRALRAAALLPARPVAVLPLLPGDSPRPRTAAPPALALRAAAPLPARPVAVLPLLPGDASHPRSCRRTFVLSLLGALILIHGISAETRQARTESPSSWSGRPVPPVAPWSSLGTAACSGGVASALLVGAGVGCLRVP